MFEIIKPGSKFDFVGTRFIWLGISVAVIVATFIGLGTKGLNYGIDFTGGAEVQVQLPKDWDSARVREALSTGGSDGAVKDARIQSIGEATDAGRDYLIRTPGVEGDLNAVARRVEFALRAHLKEGELIVKRVDIVGPAAGNSLRKQGMLAMFYALGVILLYVAFRFDTRYAPGAIIALFHDSMFVLGVFVLTQKQFDLTILAALLALIGYSNNDTIIVFDRVRETSQLHPHLSIEEIVNRSINETLGRTIVTSIMTFLVAFAIWMFGGPVIENFAFTFMVGIVIGTYSSIFVASTLIIELTRYWKRKDSFASGGASGGKGKRKRREYTVRPEPKI